MHASARDIINSEKYKKYPNGHNAHISNPVTVRDSFEGDNSDFNAFLPLEEVENILLKQKPDYLFVELFLLNEILKQPQIDRLNERVIFNERTGILIVWDPRTPDCKPLRIAPVTTAEICTKMQAYGYTCKKILKRGTTKKVKYFNSSHIVFEKLRA